MAERAAAERVPALDLARGLAVAFMIAVHVLEEWGSPATRAGPVGSVIEFFGSAPAAPVFVFLMGASLAWSSRAAPGTALRRGAGLLALGLGLNAVRGSLPALLGLWLGLITPAELAPYTPWNLAWIVDILVFAGPALALLALARAALRPWALLLLALGIALAAPHLWGLTTGLCPVDAVLRSLWGTGVLVSFPLFPWLGYGLVGLAWGAWLRAASDAGSFFRRSALAGLALLALGLPALLADPSAILGHHWRVGPGLFAWILGFVLVWVSVCHLAAARLPAVALRGPAHWSRHVTAVYVAQWLVIAWGTGAVGRQVLGPAGVLVAIPPVMLAAEAGLRIWLRLRR